MEREWEGKEGMKDGERMGGKRGDERWRENGRRMK